MLEVLELTAPLAIETGEDGRVSGLRVQPQIIGEPRRGRPAPRAARGQTFKSTNVARRAIRSAVALEPGDRVTHDSFGLGTVLALEGVDDNTVASVDFGSAGVKRLLLRYAPLEKL